MSRRYIDADALREHLQNKLKTDYEMGLYNHGALTESFIRFVERQPTADVVAVVRCKDCKHLLVDDEGYTYCSDTCGLDGVDLSDYCSDGMRGEK